MKKEFLPGWLLMLVIGVLATLLSKLIVLGGKNPIEAAVIAILLGILIRNTGLLPGLFLPGIKAFEKILILGIVLIGASLNFKNIGSQGVNMLIIILVTMTISFFVIYYLAKIFHLPRGLAVLLSVGTTICGGSAIAVTAPLIKAKEEETSYAIGTIALCPSRRGRIHLFRSGRKNGDRSQTCPELFHGPCGFFDRCLVHQHYFERAKKGRNSCECGKGLSLVFVRLFSSCRPEYARIFFCRRNPCIQHSWKILDPVGTCRDRTEHRFQFI
jgi:hypothetical protein